MIFLFLMNHRQLYVVLKSQFENYHNGYMDRTHVGCNQVGLWSSKQYRIVANVHILQNVMLIFPKVRTNTGKNPIPANWFFHLKKTISLFNFSPSTVYY
jgi:pyridoxine/pyridoxamine 5'-phosphate oxidase